MSRRVLRGVCNSNSTKLTCCGGLLVAAAAVGGLSTRFFTSPAAGAGKNDIQQQAMQAGGSKGGKGPESFCQTAYCGMTIPAGETFELKQDLVCTEDTAGKDEFAVAITVEEGATLNCGGNSIVQLNDEVGKAVNCTISECDLAWGATGVQLKSGAKVENCKVSGWESGLLMSREGYDDVIVEEIKIDNCEATLNFRGLDAEKGSITGNGPDRVDYSVKNRYVYLLMYLYDSTFISLRLG